jgi:hypothetical protein
MNRHPTQEEADEVRASYKEKVCSYGDDCQTEGCLYWHPWEAAAAQETTDYTGEICSAVEGLHLQTVLPTFEQWLTLNCPPPPTMDENHVYSLWHYPGSGMQRSPWDVYCLMYPETIGASTFNSTSQEWKPEASHTSPQSWEVNSTSAPPQNEDPKSFQEWKKKGQPYPSWFCFDLDPWYDDEGVRRSLEEVYEILYGENAEINFTQKQQAQNVANDPTPAELAAMLNADEPQAIVSSLLEPASSSGGWASIAAKPPVPVAKISVSDTKSSTSTGSDNHSATLGNGSSNNQNILKTQMVPIPKEVWLPSTANSDCFHLYPNAIERFKAVNNHHSSYLASVSIPLCFDSYRNNDNDIKNKRGGKVALLDVHFQSAKTITPVLNRFLIPAVKKSDEVWIITGSGHHVTVGHQRREGGGVLFNAVKRYLEDHEEEMEWEFRVGKDCSGGKNKTSGGALLVRKITT